MDYDDGLKLCIECQRCCHETEMPLCNEDIKRISRVTGLDPRDFSRPDGEFTLLKNRQGKCVFLRDEGCSIYQDRPQGCRFYPLVYDEDLGKCVYDRDCPSPQDVLPPVLIPAICIALRIWIEDVLLGETR